jgi:hypothetical protein
MNLNLLYTLRWHLQNEKPVTDPATKEAAIALVTSLLDRDGGDLATAVASPALVAPAPQKTTPLHVVDLVPVGQDFPLVGRPFQRGEFPRYLLGITPGAMKWSPSLVVVHHCAAPSLAQRPDGFTGVHMRNLRDYYNDEMGWSAGPHFFVDEDQVWGFSPVTHRGVHAKSFNGAGIGLEMLGNYDSEDPRSGRGREVVDLTAWAVACLLRRFNLDLSAVRFHRDDPKTTKTCPGRKIDKAWFLSIVESHLVAA